MDRRTFLATSAAGALALVAGCSSEGTSSAAPSTTAATPPVPPTTAPTTTAALVPGTPSEMLERSQVPIVGFHQLREHTAEDSDYARTLITPPEVLRSQLTALRDAGYEAVTATAVVDHVQYGTPLAEKPVLLSFDDGSVTHHTVGLPLLQELGLPAIFFPMTVVLDKEDWLSSDQLREIDAAGMEVGAHSWDHERLDRISGEQWAEQVTEPKATLEEVLGHPVEMMAYPHGKWSPEALLHVLEADYRAAFQLAEPTDAEWPLLTIRRVLPPPSWDGPTLLANLDAQF